MIKVYKGLEDYKELRTTINGVKDINSLVELIYNNPKYDITNDLRDTRGVIDLNFKTICATIKQEENGLSVLPEVEVWDDSGNLDFVVVNMYSYRRYNTTFREDGRLQITSSHPYDEQEYHYVVGNKIYRGCKYIETIKDKENIDGIDNMILRLMELDRPLPSKICHY